MTEQELAEFCRTHPFLYHVTDQHALGSIEKHGLLTAKEMDDRFMKMSKGARRRFRKRMGFPGDLEDRLSGLGMLAARLQAVRTAAWAVGAARPGMKNEKVFFFVTRKAAEEMAEEYRNHPIPRVVLKIDTRSFLEAHLDSVELSAHYTCLFMLGRRVPPSYGFSWRPHDSLFRPVSEYAYGVWRRVNGPGEAVRELAVAGSVPNVFEHVVGVERLTEGVAGEPGPWWEWFSRGERHRAAAGHAASALG